MLPRRTPLAAVLMLCATAVPSLAAPPATTAGPAPTPAATPPAADAATTLHLVYGLYSHGFHALGLTVDATLAPAGYAITLHSVSTGLIGMLIRSDTTSTASGRFDGDRAVPIAFNSSGFSRGAKRATRIDYPDGNPVVRVLTPIDPDRDPVPAVATARAIDTLAGIMQLIRTVADTGACDGQGRLFDGLRLSTMTVRTAGHAVPPPDDAPPDTGPALRCDLTALQLAGFLHNADEPRMRLPQHGTAWLARVRPDAPLLPVGVTFEHPRLGRLSLRLESASRP